MPNAIPYAAGELNRARCLFFDQGKAPAGLVPRAIERSWGRCAHLGVPIGSVRDAQRLTDSELRHRTERERELVELALPVLDELGGTFSRSGNIVVLTDARGLILDSRGDTDFMGRAATVALKPGVAWDEASKGTNAIGTAIEERGAVVVFGGEHYVANNGFLTCSAAPVFDPFGSVKAVVDVSGDWRSHQSHTLGLVTLAASLIEQELFAQSFPDAMLVRFHPAERAPGLCGPRAAFDPDGRLIAANGAGRALLGALGRAGIEFAELFGIAFPAGGTARGEGGMLPDGRAVRVTVERGPVRETRSPATQRAVTVAAPAVRTPGSLDRLASGDARMAAVADKARRTLGRDIPLVIEGESGTGKEWLAHAIHRDGPRGRKPFVAVNCAAIPEGLIESELFGYREGAFTGAHRKGAAGLLKQADGGVLFLDEIGDMPLALQARLLRVLQERAVTPLGADRSLPVDIHVICATHRRLRDLVAARSFREDLYYRLNGLTLTLPALRERTDLVALAHAILAEEHADGPPVRFAPAVLDVFRRHRWPGNVRQLRNVIRTSLALHRGGEWIDMDCLPEDFLAEIDGECSRPPAGAAIDDRATGMAAMERAVVRRTLEACGGNVSSAARSLGISRNRLYRKLKEATSGG